MHFLSFKDFLNTVIRFTTIYFNPNKINYGYRLTKGIICKAFLYYVPKDHPLLFKFNIYRDLIQKINYCLYSFQPYIIQNSAFLL